MISATPPFRVIDGYTLFGDHARPELFYVLPQAPSLAVRADGRPDLSLVQYLGTRAGGDRLEGGLLTLTLALGLDAPTLATLTQRLAQTGVANARLTAVPFGDGSVELIALGRSSAEEGAAADDPRPFDVTFLGSGRPSLGGENRATFQLLLDAPAAELLERSLDAPDLPLVAAYRLAFTALRESFQVRVTADWRRVHTHLKERFQANLYYATADVQREVEQALEVSGLEIDTTVFSDQESARTGAARAREQLVAWATERMFEPVIDPTTRQTASIGEVVDGVVGSIVRAVVPGASLRLRELDESQLRLMSARLDETVAERHEVAPQGTLGSLLRTYREDADGEPRPEWPALRDALVQKVNLDGFPRLEVTVACEDRFVRDGLAQVTVDLARWGDDDTPVDPHSFTFRDAATRHDYRVNLLGQRLTQLPAPYRYRATARFDPTGAFGPHASVTGPWREGRTTELYVEPRDLYSVREVEVTLTPAFPFGQFPTVEVELRGGDDDARTQRGRIRLDPGRTEAIWAYVSFAPTPAPFEYRTVYFRAPDGGGSDLAGDWREHAEDVLSIPDPMPRKRHLNLFVDLPWSQVRLAFVQLRYDDAPNGIRYDEQVDLEAANPLVRRTYAIADDGPTELRYRLTLLLGDGRLLEGGWRTTDEERLVLDRRLVDERVVGLRVLGGTPTEHRLADVRVELQVVDAAGALRDEATVSLSADGAPASWTFLLGDPPVRTVRARATFVAVDGFREHTAWTSTDADLLVVHLGHRTITG